MSGLRIPIAVAFAIAVVTPACAAGSSYVASDWKDLVSKVSCKDVAQRADGQWQIMADVSISGTIKSDPFVPSDDVEALQKRCPAAQPDKH